MQGRGKIDFRSPARIVDQIEALREEGINRFTIQDPFFVEKDRRLVRLADELMRRNVSPTISTFSHIPTATHVLAWKHLRLPPS